MKQLINKVTGLQVGFTTEWVVLDNNEWRILTTDEKVLVDTDVLAKEKQAIEDAKPKVLTPKQARLALLQVGLYDTVNQAVKLNPAHEIYWEYALEVRRDDALLIELSTALAITSEQLDGLFELGSTL